MQAKAFNSQVFLETLCNFIFAALVIYLLNSGNYLLYVTPRLRPYLIFAAILASVWALYGLSRLFRPQHLIRSAHCFVLMIPVLLLLLPHGTMSAADISTGYTGAGALIPDSSGGISSGQPSSPNQNSGYIADSSPDAESSSPDDTALPQDDGSSSSDVAASPYVADIHGGLDEKNKKITISNEDFYPWIAEIYSNIDKYAGYQITVTGFVFKGQEYFEENEFVPARLAMTCCTADLSPVGLLCKYDKVAELESEQWITVEGVLHKGQYNGQDEPQLTVTNITPAEEVEGYVFPY